MRFLFAIVLACALVLIGCGSADPTGAWTGKLPGGDVPMPLQLKKDHTYSLMMGQDKMLGKWSQSGSSVTLLASEINGMKMEDAAQAAKANGNNNFANKPFVLTLNDDGTFMTGRPPSPGAPEITFKKN